MSASFSTLLTVSSVIGWRDPLKECTGAPGTLDGNDFPSGSREKLGHSVGIAEHVGHAMTFKILTDDMKVRLTVESGVEREHAFLKILTPNHHEEEGVPSSLVDTLDTQAAVGSPQPR